MPSYKIREAVPKDLEGVFNIFSLADDQHRQAHPEIFQQSFDPKDTKDYLLSSIQSKDAVIFLALNRSDIIGAILASVHQTPEVSVLIPDTYVNIEKLVVVENIRRQGVGKALMERVHCWSKNRGIQQIQLTVWDFNKSAREFYNNLGYQMLHQRMRKQLP
jgi:GNAT superfamily N-acetyltransferase